MDLLALGAALTIMTAIFAVGLAVSTVPVAARLRGRLDGVVGGGQSFIQTIALDPLRIRPNMGIFRSIVNSSWRKRMEEDLRLADSRLHAADFMAIRAALGVLGFAAPLVAMSGVAGAAVGLVLGLVGFQAPSFWINWRKGQRAKKLEGQLPEALMMLANALKSGFGLLQALNLAAERIEHPLGTEFASTVHETNVGSSTEEAFQALSERNQNNDLDLVVTAVLIQRTAGGNLGEILETVAETMRERTRIRGEISTLTAQQKLTGIVIALLPVGVGAIFMLISPGYINPLFTTTAGRILLAGGALLETIGILVISRILDIEV